MAHWALLRRCDAVIPADQNGPGGIRLGALERRMRERWRTVCRLWEDNSAPTNRLKLLEQLDYLHKLSSQLDAKRFPYPHHQPQEGEREGDSQV